MTTLTISIPIDQRAALLSGRILNAREEVSLSPHAPYPRMAEAWAYIVRSLDMSVKPPRLPDYLHHDRTFLLRTTRAGAPLTFSSKEPGEVVAAILAHIDADHAARCKDQAEYDARFESWAAQPIRHSTVEHMMFGSTHIQSHYEVLPAPEVPYGSGAAMNTEQARRAAEIIRNAQEEAMRLNQPELELLASWKARAEEEAKRRAEEEAREEAVRAAAAAAERLKSGHWSMGVGSYNHRRYSPPWAANLHLAGGEIRYDFAPLHGRAGDAARMVLPCRPGDIIAWGQKDLRTPRGSEHTIAIMLADGRMRTIDRSLAKRLLGIEAGKRLAELTD